MHVVTYVLSLLGGARATVADSRLVYSCLNRSCRFDRCHNSQCYVVGVLAVVASCSGLPAASYPQTTGSMITSPPLGLCETRK